MEVPDDGLGHPGVVSQDGHELRVDLSPADQFHAGMIRPFLVH